MLKILFLLAPSLLFALSNDAIIYQLKESKEEISAYRDLYSKQIMSLNEFVEKGPTIELKYDGHQYIIISKGEIQIWDKNEKRKIYPLKKISFEKIETYKFNSELDSRPHGYFTNLFKIGAAGVYVNQKIIPDIFLMYEFFSFDPLFPRLKGISLNVCIGTYHSGGSIGYQFVKTKWFRNTSINFGYGYNYLSASINPFFAIALNF
jgi:hypothetical protein